MSGILEGPRHRERSADRPLNAAHSKHGPRAIHMRGARYVRAGGVTIVGKI
jgi:hypothetical protein